MEKKLLKYILIVVLIIFSSLTLRKVLIIHKIENNLVKLENKTNYYLKVSEEIRDLKKNNIVESTTVYRHLDKMKMLDDFDTIEISLSDNESYCFYKDSKEYVKVNNTFSKNTFSDYESIIKNYFRYQKRRKK